MLSYHKSYLIVEYKLKSICILKWRDCYFSHACRIYVHVFRLLYCFWRKPSDVCACTQCILCPCRWWDRRIRLSSSFGWRCHRQRRHPVPKNVHREEARPWERRILLCNIARTTLLANAGRVPPRLPIGLIVVINQRSGPIFDVSVHRKN